MPDGHRPLALLTALLALLPAMPQRADAQAEYEALRRPAMERLSAAVHAGRLDEAGRTLAAYTARHPGDAIMQYNLACLAATAGQADSALACLDRALDAGYRDLHQVRTSPYLASLAHDPRLGDLLDARADTLLARMLAGAFFLEEGLDGPTLPLQPDPHGPWPQAASGAVSPRFDAEHLVLRLTPPPGGADEVIAVVALPRSLEEHETDRCFELRGAFDGSGTADLIGRPGRRQVERGVARLEPGAGDWTLRIPWSVLHPYRPPLELVLGVNVVLRREAGPDAPAQRWELIADPHAGSSLIPWRRFAPAELDPGPEPTPLLAGRLHTYLVIGDEVSAELALQGAPGGPARLALACGPPDAAASQPDTTLPLVLEPDLFYATADYRLDHLPAAGWFEASAALTAPDGTRHRWADRGFRLPADWFLQQRRRLDAVAAAEQAIVQYHLIGALRGQQAGHPHDDPAPVAHAALAAEDLLARAEATGSVLPADPIRLEGGFPTGDDALLACQLVLPEAAARRGGAAVLVVVPHGEQARHLADALAARRRPGERRSFLVAAVEQVPGLPQTGAPMIARARRWLEDLIAPAAISLVGIARTAEAALHAAMDDPDAWRDLLLLAGPDFDPGLLETPESIAQQMQHRLGSLPVILALPAAPEQRAEDLAALLPPLLPDLAIQRRAAAAVDGPAHWAVILLGQER